MTVVQATLYGAIIAGTFTVVGVIVGLFGERWVRSWGDVRCEVDGWKISVGIAEGPVESTFDVAFLNGKDLPVVAWDMRVEFYVEGEPLEEWAHPHVQVIDEATGARTRVSPVNLPSRVAVTRKIVLVSGREDTRQHLAMADRAVFVATISGARDKRVELTPPW